MRETLDLYADRKLAQWAFFRLLQTEAEDCWADLAAGPFAQLVKQLRDPQRRKQNRPSATSGADLLLRYFHRPFPADVPELTRREKQWVQSQLSAVQPSIKEWQERWRLQPTWCGEAALHLVLGWLRRGRQDGQLTLRDYTFAESMRLTLRSAPSLRFETDPEGLDWIPLWEPRERARKRLLAMAARCINSYLDDVQSEYAARGIERRRALRDHLRWLIMYQVLEMSYSAVKGRVKRSRKAVADAIRSMSNLIDLPLRPNSLPGRPAKKPQGDTESAT